MEKIWETWNILKNLANEKIIDNSREMNKVYWHSFRFTLFDSK